MAQKPSLNAESLRIREVWADNLEEEMALIRGVVEDFPYIAMDTEFPGVVAKPVGSFKNAGEYHYQTLRVNVDMLKLIQLGLCFCDADGTLPLLEGSYCLWQFNFKEFSMRDDMYAVESIELLRQSGIDFTACEQRGIDVRHFGHLFTISGVPLNEDAKWLTFHSTYDFGYLVKLLTCEPLPDSEADFFELLRAYFPALYDMKHIMRFLDGMHGGLNKLAESMDVERIGPLHQAGSDSLLTAKAFFKLAKLHFGEHATKDGSLDKYQGVLYGLGDGVEEREHG